MNRPTMQQRETCVFLRLGTEPQEALRQQRAHMVHEQHQLVQKGPVKDRAIPVAPVNSKGDGKEEIANSGHRPQEAQNVCSNTMIKFEKKGKGDIGRQVRQEDCPLRTQKSVMGQAQACQEKKVDFY